MEDRFGEPQQEGFIPIPEKVEEKKSDGLSDLFEVKDEDITDHPEDVVSVDLEEDILDADEDGTFADLVETSEEDVMGDELYGQTPLEGAGTQRRKKMQQVPKPVYRVVSPPPQVGGLNI